MCGAIHHQRLMQPMRGFGGGDGYSFFKDAVKVQNVLILIWKHGDWVLGGKWRG